MSNQQTKYILENFKEHLRLNTQNNQMVLNTQTCYTVHIIPNLYRNQNKTIEKNQQKKTKTS